ncbi:MAG: hypothetical protein Q7U80_14860, partial [Thiobacillus sp.]|nr:hypothetical protein [Thiobacillus sp.]
MPAKHLLRRTSNRNLESQGRAAPLRRARETSLDELATTGCRAFYSTSLAEPNCPGIDAADAHCFSRALLVALLAPAPLLFYRTAQWVADACGS